MLAPHPFGREITAGALIEKFTALKQWEDRYRQLIMLAKQLPPLPEALRAAEMELSGCENRVWLGHQLQADGTLHFYGDSEGRIVRGRGREDQKGRSALFGRSRYELYPQMDPGKI